MTRLDSFFIPDCVLWNLGSSVQNKPLDAMAISPGRALGIPMILNKPTPAPSGLNWILLLAGVHGDEIEGIWLMEKLRSSWGVSFPFKKVGVIIWACVNPDGYVNLERWNANQVDLNRNLPTNDWTAEVKNPRYPPGRTPGSEPETRALMHLIQSSQPQAILSAHSYEKPQVNINGPALEWGREISEVCGYPVTENIGYLTPGSLGTYTGSERHIPTITLEIQRGLSKEDVLNIHTQTIKTAIGFWDK